MAYAIARIKKLKRSSLGGSEAHTARQRETPNADRNKKNIRFIGNQNSDETLDSLVIQKIGEQKRKIRPDAVYAVEILLTASPEYFRPDCPTQAGYYEADKVQAWLTASQQWLEENYSDRIVRAELHLDEATPHIHAYFVPLDEQRQLRAKHFFDGRQKMRQFQDSYSAATEHLGLERGIKGSKAQHQDIKDFYSIVNAGIEPNSRLTQSQMQAKAADRDRAQTRKQELERTAKALAQENERLQQRIQELEASKNQWLQQATLLRELALEDVAWQLGLDRDGNQANRWKGHGYIINIDGPKFYDFAPGSQKGGGGAIDLVMHVNNCDFKKAIAWLSDRFGESGVMRAAIARTKEEVIKIVQQQSIQEFTPPAEDESQWLTVRSYLTRKRGLPENLVTALFESRLVYADERKNAVFGMRSLSGEVMGAFVRGTVGEDNTFMGYAKGTKRADSWFYLKLFGEADDDIERVILCKSPIDTLSVAALELKTHSGEPPVRTMYMAVDSPQSLPLEFLRKIKRIGVAFDNDALGDEAARAVKELLPQAKIVMPDQRDWNQQLLATLEREQLEHKPRSLGLRR
ncbi:MobV family relaxase [Nostoc sphaeroides]|uniref:Plasmid recombination enzyme n=1 Tax=Nostoc sphaeroides CCNUC1 TaxID=2653204 RepID=A0A5P8WM54_9NOSO|nr:MobV family relaxase [Nostoc sphaeroides]QFS52989.1 plasmid recombination enzyme [Nostoc sphaeroides CCNUC1]